MWRAGFVLVACHARRVFAGALALHEVRRNAEAEGEAEGDGEAFAAVPAYGNCFAPPHACSDPGFQ